MTKSITRRSFLRQTTRMAGAVGAAAVWPGCQLQPPKNARQPNIVLILVDDLGYGDVGCYGCPDIRTTAIDKLAAEGVRFTSFYANAPECTPTRTALLTGRYQHRVGGLECALGIGNVGRYDDAIRLRETHDLGLPASEVNIAQLLKDSGYATAVCGKWHLGYERKFFPDKLGFDYSFGPLGGAVDYFHHCEYTGEPMLYRNGRPIQEKGYLTDLITRESVQFIRRQKDGPFFLYVPYTAPHTPYQGPQDRKTDYIRREDFNKGTRDTFVKMVEQMDHGVAQIIKTLEESKLLDNTLVIFMSDNGGNSTARNTPYSGYKGGLFEGGIRVPCIASYRGVLPAGAVSEQPCLTLDFSNSVARIAGVKPPKERPFDGVDILQWIETGKPVQKRILFWRARRGKRTWKAVRDGTLKYISKKDGEKSDEYLFNLESDPAEKNNLLTQRQNDAQRLKVLLDNWEKQVKHKR